MQKRGLGRGLGALLPQIEEPVNSQISSVEAHRIVPNPLQPRRSFDGEKIDELAASIREKGVVQPLVVRRKDDGYELIAGERRLRAALKIGLKELPVVVREATDTEALQLALIENLQREDLNPIDEARAYERLKEEFGWTQEEIATKVGKSRPAVSNSTRLLLLPHHIQEEIVEGKIPAGQARALLGLGREPLITAAAREVITKNLSTRETEKLVRHLKSGDRAKKTTDHLDPNLSSLVAWLQQRLGTKVRITHQKRSGRGKIEIEYYSTADFERLVHKMTQERKD